MLEQGEVLFDFIFRVLSFFVFQKIFDIIIMKVIQTKGGQIL